MQLRAAIVVCAWTPLYQVRLCTCAVSTFQDTLCFLAALKVYSLLKVLTLNIKTGESLRHAALVCTSSPAARSTK